MVILKPLTGDIIVSSVVLNGVTFEAKSGDQLEDVSMGLVSPQMVAICSSDDGPAAAIDQLLLSQGNIIDGSVEINGQDIANFRRHPERVMAFFENVQLKGKTVEKVLHRALRHVSGALDVEHTLQMLLPLGIKYNIKTAILSAVQQQELKIIILLALRRPVVVLGDALDGLTEKSRLIIGNLIKDYTRKTDSLVIFTSDNVSTMMRFANIIYYFNSNRLTSARDLTMNDGVDCTVTVTGTGFPVEMAVKLGAHMLEEAENEVRFLFTGNIQALLPLLEQSTITDVRIEDSTVEDELMAY